MGWIGKWLDLSLRTKCLLLISFPAAATVAMAGASYIVGAGTAAATEQLNRSLRIGIEIESLRASEIQASADVRAYLISADERFANKARVALAAFDTAWQNLSELTTGDPAQRLRLAQAAALERSRVERIVKQTLRFGSESSPRDNLVFSLEAAETERLALERILEGMHAANGGAIGAYLVRVDQLRGRQNGIMTICVFFGIAGGVIMTLLFAQGITGRVGKIQENIAQIAAGTGLDRLLGRDEIGALSDGLVAIERLISQQRAALEHAPSGIAEVDGLGCYRWTNRAYAKMAGLSEVYRPRNLDYTVPALERPKIQEAMRLARTAGRAEITARIEPPNNPASELQITFLQPPGQPGDLFYVFLGETARPGADEGALIRAKDDAVASNRTKSDFLARISHDIRTPLNAILGTADLLSQTALSFDQSEYVHMFQRNCHRLLALINDSSIFRGSKPARCALRKRRFKFARSLAT
jgi:signal transduction histidine kinase